MMLNQGQIAALVIFGPFLFSALVFGIFLHFYEKRS